MQEIKQKEEKRFKKLRGKVHAGLRKFTRRSFKTGHFKVWVYKQAELNNEAVRKIGRLKKRN